MKRFTIVVLSLVLILSLTACSGNEADGVSIDTGNLKMGRVNYAPHGTKSFAVVVAAMSGDTIVGASIDEYQFLSSDTAKGVPNSDKLGEGEFGSNYKDPSIVLASKLDNSEVYSKNMKEKAGATKTIEQNFQAIEKYVVGKTIAELESTLKSKSAEQMVDAVSGATLADTKGYVTAILEAAKSIK